MKNVFISDVSLKNGNISNSLSFKEKLEVAKKIDELGVDFLEVGPVKNFKVDEVLIKTVCTVVKHSTVVCATDLTEESIDKTFALIKSAKHKRLLISVPVSSVLMEYSTGKKPKAILESVKSLTQKASSLCETEVSFEDATRADIPFLTDCINTAINSGAKAVTLVDCIGNMLPSEFSDFLVSVKNNVSDINKVQLFVQYGNDFEMGASCLLSAIYGGVNGVKLSALGCCKLCDFGSFINTLDTIAGKKGYSTKINKTIIKRVIDQISSFTSKKGNTPFDSVIANKTEYLAKDFSKTDLQKIVKELGYDLTSTDIERVYDEFKRISENKNVNTKDLDVIIATTALQVPATYTLKSFNVNSSNVTTAMASVVLVKKGKELKGLSYGNGSIDAAFLAIESITGKHFEVDDFQIYAVSEGKEAMAETILKLRSNGKIYSGSGVSTDIVGSGIRAYVNVLNKIIYEEK